MASAAQWRLRRNGVYGAMASAAQWRLHSEGALFFRETPVEN